MFASLQIVITCFPFSTTFPSQILGGYGCHGGYKKEEIKPSNSNKNEKAKKDSKKSKEAGATKDKKAGKDAAKAATKDAAKAAEIANTQAVPKPGQQTQQLNWGNVQLAASGKPSTPAVNPSEVVDKSQGGGVKNWWKVGDGCVHWGHDHWGTPHHLHPCGGGWEYGHTGMKHGHGHFRDEVRHWTRFSLKLPFGYNQAFSFHTGERPRRRKRPCIPMYTDNYHPHQWHAGWGGRKGTCPP